MMKRNFAAFLLATVASIAAHSETQAAESAASKPLNLLVIMTDEHNFRTLGCYRKTLSDSQAFMWGRSVVETPNLDWIAANGAMCTSFYATTPVCSPSRGCFVTGRYPQNTPVTTNNIPLNDDEITFAEILKRKGYATGYAGKWHLDGFGKPQWAPKRKFGFDDNRYMFNRGHWKKFEDTPDGPRVAARKKGEPTYNLDGADEKSFSTDFLCDRTIDFLNTNKGKPFCYMLSLPDPHGPDTVRAPYDTMYAEQEYTQPKSANKPEEGLPGWGKKQVGKYDQSKYYGMVRCIDDNVGKIVDTLRKNGQLQNTILVFTSDHGDLRGEHHRQNKGVPYEGSTKVAFLMHAPGLIRPKTIVNQALTSVDFLPTVLDMMHVETAGREEGRVATALFTGGDTSAWKDVAFYRATGTTWGWITTVSDRHKLVLSSGDLPWLFDLERDPDEVINFFENPAYRQTIKDLAVECRDYAAKHNDLYAKTPRIAADLEWAINGTGDYQPPNVPPHEKKNRGRQKNK